MRIIMLFIMIFFNLSSFAAIPVSTLYLEMRKDDAVVLFRKEPHDNSSFKVTINERGQRLTGKVKVKGSFSRNFMKKSILIKITMDKGYHWRGQRKIALNAMATDPSRMREWMTWDLINKLNMPHPKVEYTKLYINQQYIGLFLFIEWITPQMFGQFGAGETGELYHPIDSEYCGDLSMTHLKKISQCWYKLAPRNNDFSRLKQLVLDIEKTPVAEFDKFVNKHFDTDSLINWILVNTLVSSNDSYNKNYFIYYSKKTQKWFLVAWDFDLTYGRIADVGYPFPKNILNENFQYYYSAELGSPSPLKRKTLSNKKLLKTFRAHLRHVLGVRNEGLPAAAYGWFKPENFSHLQNKIAARIFSDLSQDIYDPIDDEVFFQHVDTITYYNTVRYHFLNHQVLQASAFNTPRWIAYQSYAPFSDDERLSPKHKVKGRHVQPLVLAASVTLPKGISQHVFTDEQLARPLGIISTNKLMKPLRIRLEVEMEHAPIALPPGTYSAEHCVQRNWYVDLKSPKASLKFSLVLDYLEESSQHHEKGSQVKNEQNLQLWSRHQGEWHKINSTINTLANTFKTEIIQLHSGAVMHFVACNR